MLAARDKPRALSSPPGWGLKALVLMGAPMSGAGIDIFIPSLPAISQVMAVGQSEVALTIPVYLLAYGLAQPLFGSVSDAYGRRAPLLAGVVLFFLGSVLAAAASSLQVLLLARVLQGIGVSGPAVLTKAVLTDAFEGDERMKMANTMTIAWAVGPVLSPALGGYLQAAYGWRAPFAFLAVYSAAFLVAAWLGWEETLGEPVPFRPAAIWRSYKKILGHPAFVLLVLMLATLYSFMTVFNVLGPFLVQGRLGYSPVEFGNIALGLGFGWFLGNVLNKLLSRRWSRMTIVWTGLLTNLFLIVVMTVLSFTRDLEIWSLLTPTFALFVVGGAVFPNVWGRALSLFPESAATAGALLGTILILGAGLSSAVAAALPTDSARPISLAYLVLILLALTLARGLHRYEPT